MADNAAEVGVLRYGYSQQPNAMSFTGYAFFPAAAAIGGDIWIGAAQAGPDWDFYRPDLLLHETLHALGLKHPFDSGAVLPTAQDIIPNTVMSYSPVAGGTSGYMSDYPAEPMALDIAALQYLYGASGLNAGDTVYDLATAPIPKRVPCPLGCRRQQHLRRQPDRPRRALDLNQGATQRRGREGVRRRLRSAASPPTSPTRRPCRLRRAPSSRMPPGRPTTMS